MNTRTGLAPRTLPVHLMMGWLTFWICIYLNLVAIVCSVRHDNVEKLFQKFIQKHNKEYKKGSEEYYLRMKIFTVG